ATECPQGDAVFDTAAAQVGELLLPRATAAEKPDEHGVDVGEVRAVGDAGRIGGPHLERNVLHHRADGQDLGVGGGEDEDHGRTPLRSRLASMTSAKRSNCASRAAANDTPAGTNVLSRRRPTSVRNAARNPSSSNRP